MTKGKHGKELGGKGNKTSRGHTVSRKLRIFLSLLVAVSMVMGLLLVKSPRVYAATQRITSKTDSRITPLLNAIDQQNFSSTSPAITAARAKDRINHFIFNSTFKAIGGGIYPHRNNLSNVSKVQDNLYSRNIFSSKGCISYCYFVSNEVHNRNGAQSGSKIGSRVYRNNATDREDFKNLLKSDGQAGEQIRVSGTHSLSFISCTNDGFYALEYCGDTTAQISLSYWTYGDFLSKYSGYTIWLYNANPSKNQTITYDVKFNANGGTGAPATQKKVHDTTLVLSSTKPTWTGRTFLGWSTSSTATSATYQAGGNYTANAAATLYAVWQTNTYDVKFNANGGTGAPFTQKKVHDTPLILSAVKPTLQGHTFLGWATSPTATSATYQAGGNYTANAAATLFAVWKVNTFSLQYNANGGSGSMPIQTLTYGVCTALAPNQFTLPGYRFQAWSRSAVGNPHYFDRQRVGELSAGQGETIHLYALWEKEKQTFVDVAATSWCFDYVEGLAGKGYINGFGNTGEFRPQNYIERQHVAKIVVLASGLDYEGKRANFPDILPTDTMSPFIAALNEEGIIKGYPDGRFMPRKSVSRAEAAAIITRAFDLKQVGSPVAFPDTVNHWAKNEVSILYSVKAIKGYADGLFKPNNPVTRAELSKMVSIAMAVAETQKAEKQQSIGQVNSAQRMINALPVNQDLETRAYLQARLDAVPLR